MKKSFYASTVLAVALTSLLLACGGGGGNPGKVAGVEGTSSLPNTGGSPTVSATSPDQSISLTVGSGDTIQTTANEIKYRKIFAATVTDKKGTPIQGARVSVSAQMLGYLKGSWRLLPSGTNASGSTEFAIGQEAFGNGGLVTSYSFNAVCPNEDLNGNNILDAGEDANGSGELEPRIASVVVGAVDGKDLTDAQGIVYIAVEYAKKDASWLAYQLTVSTSDGASNATEVTTKFKQWTGWVAGDETKDTNPFQTSRFGVQAGCNNTN